MTNICITGGAGFIGSHIAEFFSLNQNNNIVILDKLTYAGDLKNIHNILLLDNVRFIEADICNFDLCVEYTKNIDLLIHSAAESHVDHSFINPEIFISSNVVGTYTLLEASKINKIGKIIYISTDEVYGEIIEGNINETAPFCPTNPYSGSKAAAEQLIKSYFHSFKIPIVIVRPNNIYGIRQYPEKLIPKFILSLINNKKLTIHGTGESVRSFLAVEDFIQALNQIIDKGIIGEAYNIGSKEEYSVLSLAQILCNFFGHGNIEDRVSFINDRPFNDKRYSLDTKKLTNLGWSPQVFLLDKCQEMIQWYEDHKSRYQHLFN